MVRDETTVERSIKRKVHGLPHVDVSISVRWDDDEEARELADALAGALHDRLEEETG